MTPNCGNCHAWFASRSETRGLCRRHPPVSQPYAPPYAPWVVTQSEDWCAEWLSKEPAAENDLDTQALVNAVIQMFDDMGEDGVRKFGDQSVGADGSGATSGWAEY